MLRKDADTDLYFLSGNGIISSQFSNDEWYHLNRTPSTILILNSTAANSVQAYLPANPASPLGCINQYQFCNTAHQGTNGCGPLASLRDAVAGALPFFDMTYDEFRNNSFRSMTAARFLYFSNIYFAGYSPLPIRVLLQLGPTSLTSQKTLYGGIQGPLMTNQWQQDVAHWWDISMAIQQSVSLTQAYFPDDSALRNVRFNYTAPEFQKLCSNQVRTSSTTSLPSNPQ